jgi:hypothetical protein
MEVISLLLPLLIMETDYVVVPIMQVENVVVPIMQVEVVDE